MVGYWNWFVKNTSFEIHFFWETIEMKIFEYQQLNQSEFYI